MRVQSAHYVLTAASASIVLLTGCIPNSAPPAAGVPPGAGLYESGTSGLASAASQSLAERPAVPAAPSAPASACTDEVVRRLLTPATVDPTPVSLTCRAVLPPHSTVTRQIVFEGRAASGSSLDCNGGRLEGTAQKGDREAVVIRSRKVGESWSRPVDVTLRNCEIMNGLRIYGLGRNGEAPAVKQSSMNRNHTEFAQAAAPSAIILDNLQFSNAGGVPLYVSPGVTNVKLSNSRFTGTSSSVAIYLDAESGGTTIADTIFDLRTQKRELIAVDGSAYNIITGNKFNTASNGGIFLYRNCGEGGTIRHQAPQYNQIEKNIFAMGGSRKPAVWLNSRNGDRSYCQTDPGHPFGSGLTSRDMAQYNVVKDNKVAGGGSEAFRNDDPTNRLSNNGK